MATPAESDGPDSSATATGLSPCGARYWNPAQADGASGRSPGAVRCTLCPRNCLIADGKTGHCRVRRNRGGRLELPFWGRISSLAIDPIEKKPLRGFLPGSGTFSVGFWGCNMDCPFCQNHEISHPADAAGAMGATGAPVATVATESMDSIARRSSAVEPGALIRAALESGAPSISYTYSEPAIHAEYVAECMRLARARGLKNVLVTNGFVGEAAGRDLLEHCDAANIDLKTASEDIYRRGLGGGLGAVRAFIAMAVPRIHVEVTTLLVPGISGDLQGIRDTARFLASLSPVPALHLTPYHPDFRMRTPPLSRPAMRALADEAGRWLPVVYCLA